MGVCVTISRKNLDEFSCNNKKVLNKISVSQDDINRFGKITGGEGEIHTNPEYARNTVFKSTLVHGLLLQLIIERNISEYLEKEVKQIDIIFLTPIKVNQYFTISATPLSRNKYNVIIEYKSTKCVVAEVEI